MSEGYSDGGKQHCGDAKHDALSDLKICESVRAWHLSSFYTDAFRMHNIVLGREWIETLSPHPGN